MQVRAGKVALLLLLAGSFSGGCADRARRKRLLEQEQQAGSRSVPALGQFGPKQIFGDAKKQPLPFVSCARMIAFGAGFTTVSPEFCRTSVEFFIGHFCFKTLRLI